MVELTQEEIERYIAVQREKNEASRKADAKERANKPLAEKIKQYIQERGGSDRTTTHLGYVLSLVPHGKKTVQWKNEFIAVAGDGKAVELQESQPDAFRLSVEPALAKAA